ncbi:hypothetical protein [Streptomyces sp. SP18BB07]|uniref:hypothetical protein n=1 Tax=Streptomyces sp. SP18BB07 TaxID=3002522 RepID=UPI002E76596A|nr:hypothetical protein [Streptomyces sp. SP18BB07]MEE1763672.1 hypothetical protein [Streptomyces sp. SP18BB07]
MTTLTTREGLKAFRERMCEQLAQLPDGLGKKTLHVEQAQLGPNAFFTHRLDDDGHHIVYDPRQVKALKVRTFLGLYAEYTEGWVLDWLHESYFQSDSTSWRDFHEFFVEEIDRAQDPEGVFHQVLNLIRERHDERAEATA